MRLLYFFINSSENGFIRHEGFNFCADYKFQMDFFESTQTHELKMLYHNTKTPIDKKFFEPAISVSTIVGNNGSGKTTLLKELCMLIGNIGLVFNENPDVGRLVIFEENNRINCYHNIKDLKINDQRIMLFDLSDNNVKEKLRNSEKGPYSLSKILFTTSPFGINESYINDIYDTKKKGSHHETDNNLFLNLSFLDRISEEYYRSKIYYNRRIAGGPFRAYLEKCISAHKTNDFQQLLDLIYYVDSYGRNYNELLKWFQPRIKLSLRTFSDNFRDTFALNKADEDLLYRRKDFEEFIKRKYNVKKFYNILYVNLLFEIIICFPYESEQIKAKIIKIQQRRRTIRTVIKDLLDNYKSNIAYNKFQRNYHQIEKFYKLTKTISVLKAPYDSFFYDEYVEMDLKNDKAEPLLRFLYNNIFLHSQLGDKTKRENGFLIRYLKLSGLTFSSGERTMLNLYSWVHMIPLMNKMIDPKLRGYPARKLKSNILFMIDEIDLSLHPDWQKQIVNEMINTCQHLFKGKKVQIVFSTHSPIVLSDMPKDNIVFLKSYIDTDGRTRCLVDDNENHLETFGKHIYDLYRDAFFLNTGQIGEFAKSKINSWIAEINKESVITQQKADKFLW